MVQNSVLAKEEYGFRNDSSADRASYILTQEILTVLNDKQIAGGIFCDLRKVFDVVNHKILLKKLEHYRIVGKVNALVKSYISERYQRVVMQNNNKKSYSDWEMVKHGDCKDLSWGPLFSLLFINDLPLVTSNKNTTLVLYADDTSMIVTGFNPVQFSTEISTTFDDIN
jgi:hypothetical protein